MTIVTGDSLSTAAQLSVLRQLVQKKSVEAQGHRKREVVGGLASRPGESDSSVDVTGETLSRRSTFTLRNLSAMVVNVTSSRAAR